MPLLTRKTRFAGASIIPKLIIIEVSTPLEPSSSQRISLNRTEFSAADFRFFRRNTAKKAKIFEISTPESTAIKALVAKTALHNPSISLHNPSTSLYNPSTSMYNPSTSTLPPPEIGLGRPLPYKRSRPNAESEPAVDEGRDDHFSFCLIPLCMGLLSGALLASIPSGPRSRSHSDLPVSLWDR